MGDTLMNEKDIAEQAYKNGYNQAFKDIVPDGYRATWKSKFFVLKKENERLQKQVDELMKYAEDIYKKAIDREEAEKRLRSYKNESVVSKRKRRIFIRSRFCGNERKGEGIGKVYRRLRRLRLVRHRSS